jgi:hypothetical protein
MAFCRPPAWLQAGDQSEYVGAFRKVILDCGSRLGPNMPSNYFRYASVGQENRRALF